MIIEYKEGGGGSEYGDNVDGVNSGDNSCQNLIYQWQETWPGSEGEGEKNYRSRRWKRTGNNQSLLVIDIQNMWCVWAENVWKLKSNLNWIWTKILQMFQVSMISKKCVKFKI